MINSKIIIIATIMAAISIAACSSKEAGPKAKIDNNNIVKGSNVFKKYKKEIPYVYYKGEAIISGTYIYNNDGPSQMMIGDQISYWPDNVYAKIIPREGDDTREPWFCFENTEQAKELLAIDNILKDPRVCEVKGIAKVLIKNYIVDRTEGDVNDTAELVKVIYKSEPIIKYAPEGKEECE